MRDIRKFRFDLCFFQTGEKSVGDTKRFKLPRSRIADSTLKEDVQQGKICLSSVDPFQRFLKRSDYFNNRYPQSFQFPDQIGGNYSIVFS